MELHHKTGIKTENQENITFLEGLITKRSLRPVQSSHSSPFSQFCMSTLSPIPGPPRISSPVSAFNLPYLLHRNFTPKVIQSPSPFFEERVQDFTQRAQGKKYIQKLDFTQITCPSFTFKANSVSVSVKVGLEVKKTLEAHQLIQNFKHTNRLLESETRKSKGVCCNCQKSRCLKLYCDCFAAGVYCKDCNCSSCMNQPEMEQMRKEAISVTLGRNPQAFQHQINTVDQDHELLVRHHKGCNCKRSGCLKRYCKCYQAHVRCTDNCKCSGCRNCEPKFQKKSRRDDLYCHDEIQQLK